MINNRPKYLLDQHDYRQLPQKPFAVDFGALPELVRKALGPLGGIQPVTAEMGKVAKGDLRDMPSPGEIELFKSKGTMFQPLFLVLSIAHLAEVNGTSVAMPYALSLMPTSKRGGIDEKGVELITALDAQSIIGKMEPCYANFDPFTGDRGLFGGVGLFLGQPQIKCFLDELGLVVGQYYLAKSFDPGDVIEVPLGLPSERAEEKYRRHRAKLLYAPFSEIRPRRVWGAQSPIELFLFQELLRRGLSPILQVLIFDEGSIHPSLYHLWRDPEFRHSPGILTEPDMYFPEQKLAVFCDSTGYHRGGKAQAKDAKIDQKLAELGVGSVRVPGKLIVDDVKAAADMVEDGLKAKMAR